jgi:hypothetical protein
VKRLVLLFLLLFATPAEASRTLAVDNDGAVHAFMVGTDGALYHAPPGGTLKKVGGSGLAQEPVAAAVRADGKLAVFARGNDNGLYTSVEPWTTWTLIGAQVAGSPDVARNANGRLVVVTRRIGNTWAHADQLDGNAWSSLEALPGQILGDPVLEPNDANVLYAFARDTSNTFVAASQTGPNSSSWTAVTLPSGATTLSDPDAARNHDGRLELFGRRSSETLGNLWQTKSDRTKWDASELGGGVLAGKPAAELDADTSTAQGARLHVFVRDLDGALRHRYQEPPGGGWGDGWRSFGGNFTGDPFVVRDGDGLLHVAITAADGTLYKLQQRSTTPEDWGGFVSLGRAAPPAPAGPGPGQTPDPGPGVTPSPGPSQVIGDPPPVAASEQPLQRIIVTIKYSYVATRRATTFKRLTVSGVPRGSTVRVTCAKGCSRKSYVKRNARGTISLMVMARKPIKAGSKLRVTVTKPGMTGAVKLITIRPRKEPSIATRCLAPGATRETTCARMSR